MKNNKNPVILETLRLSLGMTVCLAIMLGVYWFIDKFTIAVLIGGVTGTLVAIGNFFFMAVGLSNIVQDSTEAQVRLRTQGSFMIRTLALLMILVLAIKVLKCDALATLLPLLFTRPILSAEQFILKAKEERHANSD